MGKERIGQDTNYRQRIHYDGNEWGSLIPFFKEVFVLEEEGYAENTAENWHRSVRKFFIWFKSNRIKDEDSESDVAFDKDDFIEYRYASTEDPKYDAETVVSWKKETLKEKLKENDGYGLINAEECIKKEEEKEEPRSTALHRFREKKRAAEDPDIGKVIIDKEDVKQVEKVDLVDFLNHRRKEIEDERRQEGKPQNKLTPKRSTAYQYKNALQHFIDMCSKEKYLNFREYIDLETHPDYEDEIEKFDTPTVNSGGSKIDYEDCQTIIRNTRNDKVRAVFLTLLKTGMRCNELVNLRFSDMHLDEKWIFLRHRKNGYQQSVCIDEELVKILKPYMESKRNQIRRVRDVDEIDPEEFVFTHSGLKSYSTKGMRDLVVAAADRFGVNIKGPHDLRHTFAYQYSRDFGGSKRGREFFKRVQLSHNQNVNTTENYSEALNEPEEGPCKERMKDYEQAMPNYLRF